MLAQTTMSHLFYMPSALQAAVYIGGLLFVLALPYIFLGIMDKQSAAQDKAATEGTSTEPQQVNS